MPDLPDWWQGFFLEGSDITINVNIEASDVTLPVDITTVTADLDVTIEAVDVTIDINFTDQSVAVWGAAAWFSRQGDQVFVTGYDTVAVDASVQVCSRVVPTGKVFYIAGCGYAVYGMGALPYGSYILLQVAAPVIGRWGSITGLPVIFDVPIRAAAGETVRCTLTNGGPNSATMCGEFWGWDEDA